MKIVRGTTIKVKLKFLEHAKRTYKLVTFEIHQIEPEMFSVSKI